MIQRILCPTDFTESSRESVAYALQLAKENSAQLIVFHATSFPSVIHYPCELQPYDYRWEQLVSRFKVDQVLSRAERKVKHFVGTTFGAEINGVAWRPSVALGKVSEEIVVAALREEVDLIVMARSKRALFVRTFTVGIPEAVSRTAPCPVLLIDATQVISSSRVWRLPILREGFQSS
jgi:nucleotide-binding universal stress UspA family protein